MAEEQQQLRLDLEELKHLESVAKRPRVVSLLSSEIRSVDANLSKISAAAAPPAVSDDNSSASASAPAPALNYVTLGSFSWDQDSDKIKIYVFLEGVNGEKVETNFQETSVDVKFHDVQGKNYRIAIPKLNKEIVPAKSKLLVKATKIIITLVKASKGNWLDLHFKEDKSTNLLKQQLSCGLDPIPDLMKQIQDLMESLKKEMCKCMLNEGGCDMAQTAQQATFYARKRKGFQMY
ncbi:hypothetical protein KSP40_PGU002791 [Platanthera guangdongensis]|uniref:CS domain-containing protein n=1 Tax=Platanthera guangdongensis TaxID=2320717 RepID=A0ABR2M352_9ASPA